MNSLKRSAAPWMGALALAASLSFVLLAQPGYAQAPRLTPFQAPAKLPDVAQLPTPDAVQLEGYLGDRVVKNEKNRLLLVDDEPLLRGFRQKPGEHPWIGEHVGKWMHAATLAWANTGDPDLRKKLDRVAAELIKAQEPDGYLGTYVPEKRFGLYPGADWDVWSHKYCLMGLLTYYQYTGTLSALEACRKMGDLLDRTFGPGRKSIISAGTHVGMAATSVLEPMVLLYRFTGEPRYLAFCKYITEAWEEPRGPHVLTTLLTAKSVAKTANGKAYEMLSNLVGLCELARATGDRKYLEAAQNAWDDVVRNELYITGTASYHEHFHADHDLPNNTSADVGETCVTVTWIQLNSQLLRLTGEAKYGNELERSYYNHLSAAQRPDGAQWCYYTSLEGKKPYGPGINCCVSSGPRGMAMAPQLAYFIFQDGDVPGIAVNFFETSAAHFDISGNSVTVQQKTEFPVAGSSIVTVGVSKPTRMALKIRYPVWAMPLTYKVGSKRTDAGPTPPGGTWAAIPARTWKNGDQVKISFGLHAGQVKGEYSNAGRSALRWGPLVLAYDEKRNADLPPINAVALPETPDLKLTSKAGEPLQFQEAVRTPDGDQLKPAVFVPFSSAGDSGGRYEIWLKGPGAPLAFSGSLLSHGSETRSREGNVNGSVIDSDPETFVVTFNQEKSGEDWYAVALDQPTTIRRVVYAHGRSFHDGGWFDASAGKPRIQGQTEKNGPWVNLGLLDSYPATTAIDSRGIKEGQEFTLRLPEGQRLVALRVIGKPACGDNPNQAFSSCAELQAFAQ